MVVSIVFNLSLFLMWTLTFSTPRKVILSKSNGSPVALPFPAHFRNL